MDESKNNQPEQVIQCRPQPEQVIQCNPQSEQIIQCDHGVLVDYTPRIGLEFDSEVSAYDFYNVYAGMTGFSIRREYVNKSRKTGQITSRKFVCCKEGFRGKDKRDDLTKNPRAETRTGCVAHMIITLKKGNNKYQVSSFDASHNHPLHVSACAHMMPSQKKISNPQSVEIKSVDELRRKQESGREDFGFMHQRKNNYLKTKRQRDLEYGEAGSLLRYFQNKAKDDVSFYYAVQLDVVEQIANIFWADSKMIIDYGFFGDVVGFNMMYGANKEFRPLGVFFGFNHHRETVVFGAALLYDETTDSFQWLFETFFDVMSGKKPKTIFTDQDPTMAKAISFVMPETYHGICTWHMSQNAKKNLGLRFDSKHEFWAEFNACVYQFEEEEEFHSAWNALLDKYDLQEHPWLNNLSKIKENWASPYMKRICTVGMRNTQLCESFNSDLRNFLKSDSDLIEFFKHFEKKVSLKRYKELESEYESRQKLPKLKMKAPMLIQAGEIYTPIIFEEFQKEYEEYQGAFILERNEGVSTDEYMVAIYGQDNVRKVIGKHVEQTVSCNCRKFETYGILCSHALKVLDVMNIKLIPHHYVLKRWTRDARDGTVYDITSCDVQAEGDLKVAARYRSLCHNLVKLACRAAECEEAFLLVANTSSELSKNVEDILRRQSSADQDGTGVHVSSSSICVRNEQETQLENPEIRLMKAKGIKKREGRKGGECSKNCIEKQAKTTKLDLMLPPTTLENFYAYPPFAFHSHTMGADIPTSALQGNGVEPPVVERFLQNSNP
ncbi:protein FAR1-RELATED SEQUENCE 5-like isoform X1 [Macadamia integrifolia]|uniref:protein FAR1-RELATED SEQUENCE 5-like isoform X1 n=1 Tax=Macadamia integrifolia TaxID=60698 RepID=UPI001C52C411|nr:protein FAR1-RELATED SEQUENCE 5-like isoform X1 [Macadamia integrifolia]XP_042478524.1 protein FAR1-RELATED SEQUENCE 5-like isoform X1 [Macadamia integrifolia]